MNFPMRKVALVLAGVAGFSLILGGAGFFAWRWTLRDITEPRVAVPKNTDKKLTEATIAAKTKAVEDKIKSLAPRGLHIVIDTAMNRLWLKEDDKVIREAVVSCGSGAILPNPKGKDWVFDTPHGEYQIQVKKKKPMWVKPDWAFVEEGLPIPPKNSEDRYEAGVMGDYAMGIGNGFYLHGTMYTRMLGRNVTHGCVRIGDEDLKSLYASVPIGTKVYLY